MKPRYVVGFVIVWLIWAYLASSILAESLVLAASCVILAVLGLRPIALWCYGKMESFPIVEAHCLVCIPAFLLPMLDGSPRHEPYEIGVQIQALEVICVYLFSLQTVSGLLQTSKKRNVHFGGSLLNRGFADERDNRWVFALLVFWWMISVARPLLLLGWLGNVLNIVQAAANAAGGVSILVFFLRLGRGQLPRQSLIAGLLLVGSSILIGFTGGFLVGGCLVLVIALLGYTMGSQTVPAKSIIVALIFVSILHAGKAEMRQRYWEPGQNWSSRRLNPVEVYAFWLSVGLKTLFRPDSNPLSTQDRHGLLARYSLAHMVMLAVSKAPDEVPFLRGKTYLQSPQLFVPRILWPDKPRGSLPTETLAIHFGANTKEGVEHTSVGMGLIAEAWANFGWAGVVVIGGLLGLLFTAPSLIAAGRAENQVGFLVAAVFLTQAINLENTLGPLLVQLTHNIVVFFLIMMLFSRPRKSHRAFARVARRQRFLNQKGERTPRQEKASE